MKYRTHLIILLLPLFAFSQMINKNHEKIFNAFSNHYHLDTESIDLHLNKNLYINSEKIYFKGNVIHKKIGKINLETTNVQVNLLNEKFEKISSNLFYTEKGSFTGQITLDPNNKPGNYYIHAFTNYMNNFQNDESTIIPIQIADNKTTIYKNETSILENWKINTISEGGVFLNATVNTIAVQITNDFGKGEKVEDILVINSKNIVINKFSTNSEGYGKFIIQNYADVPYKLYITKGDKNIEIFLPKPLEEGVNINAIKTNDKTTFKFITNKKTHDKINKNTYTILLQNNETVKLTDFKFDNDLIKVLTLNNDSIKKGINIIRLIDADLNLISERTFYNNKKTENYISINKGFTTKDSIIITGQISGNLPVNLSVSVLPKKTLSNFNVNSNFINLKANNYLINKLNNHSFYFENIDDPNYEAFDLFLLHETKSKENIKSILNKKPLLIYSFDNGLTVNGRVNDLISENELKKIKICLFSTNGTFESTALNEKKEFEFKNIYATKSSAYFIKTLKKDIEIPNFGQIVSIKNEETEFIKSIDYNGKVNEFYFINHNDSLSTLKKVDPSNKNKIIEDSKIDNRKPISTNDEMFINLNEIDLKGTLKEKSLENINYNTNRMVKGTKITESVETAYQDVLTFIGSHGFIVITDFNTVYINSRRPSSYTGTRVPLVYFNDVEITDFDILQNMKLKNIDEIYINTLGYGLGIGGNNGSIKIYEKKGIIGEKQHSEPKPNQLFIKDGFTEKEVFSNENNTNYNSEYFKRFGTIEWIPNITVNNNGEFTFKIPNTGHDTLLFNIQGIDEQGNLYYLNQEMNMN